MVLLPEQYTKEDIILLNKEKKKVLAINSVTMAMNL